MAQTIPFYSSPYSMSQTLINNALGSVYSNPQTGASYYNGQQISTGAGPVNRAYTPIPVSSIQQSTVPTVARQAQQAPQMAQGGGLTENDLINAMMQKGHTESTARGAIAGRGFADLAREYLGYNAGGGGASFDFDFAGEAVKAYGELGANYDRILKESQGDMDRALAILSDEYETGVRVKKINQENENRALLKSGLQRGITRSSAYQQPGGANLNTPEDQNPLLGVFGQERKQMSEVQKIDLDTFSKQKTRQEEDLKLQNERFTADAERQRRKEASELANTRGARAFQSYQSSLI